MKVMVEKSITDARVLCQLVHSRAVYALFTKEIQSRLQELILTLLGWESFSFAGGHNRFPSHG